jgi:hypothetical protein
VSQTTPVGIKWNIREVNAGGSGVEGRLYINGEPVDQDAIAGGNIAGVEYTYYHNLAPGDVVDLHLGPTGPTGDRSDGADGSASRLSISTNLPAGPLVNVRKVADSRTDWSATGVQGANNWLYGYHDVRANGTFEAGDFITFQNLAGPAGGAVTPAGNHWSDQLKWDLMRDAAPWADLTATGGHPSANGQGNPDVHWVVRRWVSEVDGEVYVAGAFGAPAPCGDGTVARIFVDGVEVYSQHTQGDVINYGLYTTVGVGSVIDFAMDPNGAGVADINLISDGCDSFTFDAVIFHREAFVPIPEPSTYVLAAIGLAFGGWLARRRGRGRC